jgi:flagellar basal body-associated protein FliL
MIPFDIALVLLIILLAVVSAIAFTWHYRQREDR